MDAAPALSKPISLWRAMVGLFCVIGRGMIFHYPQGVTLTGPKCFGGLS